ncbi:phosphatase PAP2 family protein [Acinetobacter sp. 187]|uniref:phosphatase PAP2 family protein n=1 Tax=Acinetobacter lanii TaxID=2715163 RepID=UPI00140B9BA2|nr:phosphatase PAP2 family protein [Acinetobacter lanii]NHC04998.1 phosphatase PAP2 family protein [Acinetobacter lanii]
MNIEQINLALFKVINAPDNASEFTISLAIFIANDLFYIVILFFLLAWLKGSFDTKKNVVKAFFFTFTAFLLSQIISAYFYYPRPFVMNIGHTIIEHAPNGSFPSDHMLFFSTIALSYLFSKQKNIGYIFLGLAFLVAWSRIYVGVHYPLDMVGAFSIALLLNVVGISLWKRYSNYIVGMILKVYKTIFSSLIKNGYIR